MRAATSSRNRSSALIPFSRRSSASIGLSGIAVDHLVAAVSVGKSEIHINQIEQVRLLSSEERLARGLSNGRSLGR